MFQKEIIFQLEVLGVLLNVVGSKDSGVMGAKQLCICSK
jgi:hypothetical protein